MIVSYHPCQPDRLSYACTRRTFEGATTRWIPPQLEAEVQVTCYRCSNSPAQTRTSTSPPAPAPVVRRLRRSLTTTETERRASPAGSPATGAAAVRCRAARPAQLDRPALAGSRPACAESALAWPGRTPPRAPTRTDGAPRSPDLPADLRHGDQRGVLQLRSRLHRHAPMSNCTADSGTPATR